jgi:ATP-dependent protease HslVU (ClpYQ) peptidase subunit
MTSIVAIRCTDGVVIGSNSSATFGNGRYVRTIRQTTGRKVGSLNRLIVPGTGYAGVVGYVSNPEPVRG